jgi:metal-responsive CopG/Arc/MetJ family transcriptional regulator
MPQPPKTTERHRLIFRMDPDDPDTKVSFRTTRRDEIDEIYEEYGFPSRSAFLRCMVELGLQNLTKDYYQNEDEVQDAEESEAKTIREMIPQGEENAVDVRNDLPEMIENELLDIVDRDAKIKRSGWKVYR